jgi:CubicO group peptidase (beta-lactamase class C family)
MMQMTRRTAITSLLSGVVLGAIAVLRNGLQGPLMIGDTKVRPIERARAMRLAAEFMQKYNVPGFSMAVARNGHIVYRLALGVADLSTQQRVIPSNLFRIASISKAITSVAIFTLIEQGKVHLSNKLFGSGGILGTDYGGPPYQRYIEEITVDHLLTHTCGGWPGNEEDPLLRFPDMNNAELIEWTIRNVPLNHRPGEHWMYSNFGYFLLGRVLEKASGMPYAEFVQNAVLARCGATDMRIRGNTREETAPNEVSYYGQDDGDPYQGNSHRADANGGWIATPTDLVRFATNVRGFHSGTDILKRETVAIMTTPSPIHPSYARGWQVDKRGIWSHGGGMPGTTSVMVTTPTGLCWAALTNTSRATVGINHDLDGLMWDVAGAARPGD